RYPRARQLRAVEILGVALGFLERRVAKDAHDLVRGASGFRQLAARSLCAARMRSGLSASTTSRLAVLPRTVIPPTSGPPPLSGKRDSRSPRRLARGQPLGGSGAS